MTSDVFRKLVLTAVDESLSSLGDSSREAVFHHLEDSFNINKESIPLNLTGFLEALEGIFGPGASYLEELMARHLHEELGLTYREKECSDLIECIVALKKHMSAKGAVR